jgi:hypothetical protein
MWDKVGASWKLQQPIVGTEEFLCRAVRFRLQLFNVRDTSNTIAAQIKHRTAKE